MPITRTPMVDDDGSGTTGTVVNNPWKQELYDQIDAALGPPAKTPLLELLYTTVGGITPTGPVNMGAVTIPAGLSVNDTLEIFWDMWIAGPAAPGSLQFDVYSAGPPAAQLLTLVGADAGGDLSGYAMAAYYIQLRTAAGYSGQVIATAHGAPTIGAPQSRGYTWSRNSAVAAWDTSWLLLFRALTSSAGTSINFNIQVYRRRGAAGLSLVDRGDRDDAAPLNDEPDARIEWPRVEPG